MFCDLVGSTSLAAKLDAEDWRNLVNAYLDEASEAVTGLGGHVLKKLGDGLMALFGYPHAQENDAERAVRAALAIQRALADLNARNAARARRSFPRASASSPGSVVVDATGEVFGDAPNVAARVQAAAEPGTVLVTASVQRQTAGLFVVEDKGAHDLKGVTAPVALYRVVRASGGGRRGGARALTPLVGREDELALLTRRWSRALEGEGQFVQIVGEPGIGKSRLVEEFRAKLAETPHTWVEWAASQLLQNTPLHPLAEWGRLRFGGADATEEGRLADLENTLRLVGLDPDEYAPLIAPLVDIPLAEERSAKLAPEELRRRQLAAVTAWYFAGARTQPAVLVFEDLHWADPTSLDLLRSLAERGAQAPLLIVATTRPEFRPPWAMRSHHGVISLAPLDRAQVRRMVGEIASRHALSDEMIDGVGERTGGVPLFVEEVTRLLLERDAQCGDQAIPPTLQQSLAARLDRLGEAREVAQIGAVLGRDFAYLLLRDVAEADEPTLRASLDRLSDADLLFVEGAPPQANYRFKHALVRDAAYQSLLKSRRQQLHSRVAKILRDRFPDRAETEPELLAHHATEGGLLDEAVSYWYKAGLRANYRSAHAEAVAHLTKGLDLLAQLPESSARDSREVDLQLALGVPSAGIAGHWSVEAMVAYARAKELCDRLGGETSRLFPALRGLWTGNRGRGQIHKARELADQLLEIAQRAGDRSLLLEAHHAQWSTQYGFGDWRAVGEHAAQGLALYRPEHFSHAFLYGGHDSAVCATAHAGVSLWMLGFPDRALARVEESITMARELSHPPSLMHALSYATVVHHFRGDLAAARDGAEARLQLARDRLPEGLDGINREMALVSALEGEQQARAGIANIQKALPIDLSRDIEWKAYILCLFAGVCELSGEMDAGLDVLEAAIAEMATTGVRLWEPELHRLAGNLLRGSAAASLDGCAAHYLRAIEIAREQQARSLELRAASSLARLWVDREERQKAYDLLAPVYAGFTEGFGTRDLIEAKVLLREIG